MGDIDKMSETTPLALELERLLGRIDPDGTRRASPLGASVLRRAWEESAGQQVAGITRGLALRGAELVVTVDNPVWAQELSLLAEKYRDPLNEALNRELKEENLNPIKSIRFRV